MAEEILPNDFETESYSFGHEWLSFCNQLDPLDYFPKISEGSSLIMNFKLFYSGFNIGINIVKNFIIKSRLGFPSDSSRRIKIA